MLFTYVVLLQAQWLFVALIAIGSVAVLFFVFLPLERQYSIKWEKLLALDERQSMKFYRTANLFTDVPKLKQSVKERRGLSILAEKVLPDKTVFEKLYQKAFVRSNEYLGIYTRLLIIGLFVIAFVPGVTGKVIGAGLFIFLTATQLRTLYPHFEAHVMIKLYPLQIGQQAEAFQKILIRLLGVQAASFAVIAFIVDQNIIEFVLLLVVGGLTVFISTMKKHT